MSQHDPDPTQQPDAGPPDDAPLPEDVRRFLLTSVRSVPYLEALLVLRSEPATLWAARQVAGRLYIGERAARDLLDALVDAGVAVTAPSDSARFCYQPASPALASLLDRVAEAYARRLVEATHLIHSRTEKRARQFADAFRWRKDS